MTTPACEHQDTWFDRVVCPEPCGGMHEYCSDCGFALRDCALSSTALPDQQAETLLRVRIMEVLHGRVLTDPDGYQHVIDWAEAQLLAAEIAAALTPVNR